MGERVVGQMDAGVGQQDQRSGVRAARRAVAALVAAAVLVIGLGTTAAPAGAAECVSSPAGAGPESEARFVAALNELRRSKGLPTVVENRAVADQARAWSAHMGGQDRLYHARDTGPGDGVEPHQDYVTLISQTVPNWSRAAENVGVGTVRSWCTAEELRSSVLAATDLLHDAFVRSSGHYANMVGDHNQVGIGVQFAGGKLWVTVRLAKGALPTPPPSQAEVSVAGRYVDAVHRLFLGRAASRSDVDRWSPAVAGGDRGRLTSALAVSNEWAGSRVAELYRTILGREPDAGGQRSWVSAIARGMRLEDVAAGFYGSQERFNSSGRSHRGYVEGLYRDILGRPAEGAGLSDWVGRLDRGTMGRSQVAAGFYGSLESRTTRVRALYDEVLGRAPDAAGQAHWVRQLSTMGDVVLASTLASSEEFWLRSTR